MFTNIRNLMKTFQNKKTYFCDVFFYFQCFCDFYYALIVRKLKKKINRQNFLEKIDKNLIIS